MTKDNYELPPANITWTDNAAPTLGEIVVTIIGSVGLAIGIVILFG